MIKVITIDPHEDARWLTFLSEEYGATIFYHPLWLRAIERTYGYRPVAMAVAQDNRLLDVLPIMEVNSWLTGSRGVCLPFTDLCAPLVREPGLTSLLVKEAEELARRLRWAYIEIRGEVEDAAFALSSRYLRHQLKLESDPENVRGQFKASHVRHIKKALENGIRVERRIDPAALYEFMRMNAITRRKHGVPPQPSSFFLNLHEFVLSSGLGFISLAFLGNKAIAASIFLHYGRVVTYKYAVSDQENLALCPNHLIVWDAVQWGYQNGYTVLDFGRTDPGNAGLAQYKRGWNTEESDLRYYRSPVKAGYASKRSNRSSKVLKPIVRLTPLPVLRILGKLIYRHVG